MQSLQTDTGEYSAPVFLRDLHIPNLRKDDETMGKKFLMIPVVVALLLTACQSSKLTQPDIVDQEGSISQSEETTIHSETANASVSETAAGLELPILDEINNDVTVATAGSFMTAVRAAVDLLDWGVNTGLDPEEIREATVSWLSKQGNDAQIAFVEKLTRVDEAYQMLLEDDAEDVLYSAGVENSGYPWSDREVEAVEAIMEAAGLR